MCFGGELLYENLLFFIVFDKVVVDEEGSFEFVGDEIVVPNEFLFSDVDLSFFE